MAETGKLKPEVTMRGLFLPWPLVVSLLLAVCGAIGVPVLGWWYETRRAVEMLQEVKAAGAARDARLNNHGERISALEARKQ